VVVTVVNGQSISCQPNLHSATAAVYSDRVPALSVSQIIHNVTSMQKILPVPA